MIRTAAALLALALAIVPAAAQAATEGGDDCFCTGCGCKGGPGYRDAGGHCVGWKALKKKCGEPPTSRCKEEKAAVVCDRGGRPEKVEKPEVARPKAEPAPLSTPNTTTRPNPF